MTRLLAILAGLLAIVTTAWAEPPVCAGTDLHAKLQRDDPAGFAAVEAEAAKAKNGKAIFWKIEKDGIAPSWLLGTAHVTDPRVTTMSPAAETAFTGAATVALELKEIGDGQAMAMATMRLAKLIVLPQGQSLWDLIPDPEEPLIRDNPNLPPGAAQTLFGYQPWVVATMLSIPACETARSAAGIAALDMMLARRAVAQGATLVGLETVEEQLGVFAAMPLDLQTDYLLAVAKSSPRLPDYFSTLVDLYVRRQIGAYMPLTLKLEPIPAGQEKILAFVEKDLTVKRNHVMQRRALELLPNGNVFIAVGALHLIGDEGLVELIRQAGYKVTPVN